MDEVAEGAVGRPAGPLRPFVGRYVGYRQVGTVPGVHRGLPSAFLTMILTLDDPLDIAVHPDPAQPGGRFEALVGGLHTAPALIRHPGRQSGVQVALTPWGASALLGPPAGELASVDLHAEDVLGRFADVLLDAVRSARTWAERFAALDVVLLRRLAAASSSGTPPLPAPQVLRAWDVLLASGGTTDVAALADAVGWTPRHLAHRFSIDVGLSPKQAARVVRFDRARRNLLSRAGSGHPARLADVAVDFGYYDQPHLDREFRALAGCAPSAWLAEELRNVQVPHAHSAGG